MSSRRAPSAFVLACTVLVGAAIAAADTTEMTLYLHSLAPTNVEGSFALAGEPGGPTMDDTEPTTPNPKVAVITAGNPDFRKNSLLSWWAGEVHGTVSDVEVRLFVTASARAVITVTIFGDGGIGVAAPLGRASAEGIGRGPSELVIPVPMDAPIDQEMVLSVDMSTEGGSLLYDSTTTPSSVSFTLGPYVAPPPPVLPLPAAGWNDVAPVHFQKANRESSLALDPTDPNIMTMCDPSGVPATGEGHSFFYLSIDGGDSWSELDPEAPGDTRSYAFEGGDCDVAFDDAGTMYAADTWLGSLSVGASTDDGVTWSGTAVAGTSPIVDRPWLVGGPDGTIHVTYQDLQFGMPSAIWYTRSTDRAQTFQPAVPIAATDSDGAYTWTGNFVVTPDGQDLYSVYTRRTGPTLGSLDDSGPETVWVATSHDGGITWTQNLVASMPNPASYLYPSIALDDGGMLHVVFSSKTDVDRPIWYAVSPDGAQTWSEPIKLLEGTSGFSPWVDAGAHGEAVMQWYGSPDPEAALNQEEDWFIYWARVTGAETGTPAITTGTTTQTPIFTGIQGAAPEFNMVRLGADGKMRIGASAYRTAFGSTAGWAAYFFAEA
ncbi:MAG TPA: sialidase family protein [Actinomycetota bacterium]